MLPEQVRPRSRAPEGRRVIQVRRSLSTIVLAATLVAGAIAAQAQAPANLERGKAVALGAGTRLSPRSACFVCHGLDGAAEGSGAFPRLDGQAPWYLYKQLKDYAAETRKNDVMTPIARELSDSDMQDVAAYYAEQSAAIKHAERLVDPLVLQRGGAISANGSAKSGVPACVNCHGMAGVGLPPSFPYLAGQYAAYLELQLQLFARGERANDPLGVMRNLAVRLSEDEIRAVARYFASVPRGAEAAADPKTKP